MYVETVYSLDVYVDVCVRSSCEALLSSLADCCLQRVSSFNGPGLARAAWAFAKVGHIESCLFGNSCDSCGIRLQAEGRRCKCDSRNLWLTLLR